MSTSAREIAAKDMENIFQFVSVYRIIIIINLILQIHCAAPAVIYYGYSQGLTSIPTDIASNTFRIDIRNNHIQNIDDSSFSFTTFTALEEIYLYNNEIESISRGAFTGLTKVTTLGLTNNKIQELELSANDLPLLDELKLENNEMTTMPVFHGSFSVLKTIFLNINKISTISSENFENITGLETIYISSNELAAFDVSKRLSSGLINFERLHLSNNMLQELELISDDFPNLNDLELINNDLTKMPTFRGMFLKLESLKLGGNKINSTSSEIFENITHLKTLDLSGNELTEFELMKSDSGIDGLDLEYLDLSNNALLKFETNYTFPNLSELLLYNNDLSTMPKLAGTYTKIKELNVFGNNLTKSSVVGFKDKFSISSDGLFKLDLGNNLALVDDLSSVLNYVFDNFPGIEKLGLAYMDLTEVPILQYHNLNKIYLNLRYNHITNVTDDVFQAMASLNEWTLDLRYNDIKIFPNLLPYLNTGKYRELQILQNSFQFECEKLCWMLDYK